MTDQNSEGAQWTRLEEIGLDVGLDIGLDIGLGIGLDIGLGIGLDMDVLDIGLD